MNLQKLVLVALTLSLVFSVSAYSDKAGSSNAAASVEAFLGRWDLTLKAPDREYPSWLEIRQEDGELKAQMVGRWGNARPLPQVEVKDGQLRFVSPKEEEERKDDMVFEGKLVAGKTLAGTTTGPDGTPWQWTGQRAPLLKRMRAPKWGTPIQLFDGKDLTGWKMDKPSAAPWKVEAGTLVSPGHGAEIISDPKFEDFKLHVEFNCAPDSNSGVYLRGRYEVQIEDDSIQEPPSHHTGAIYGFLTPTPEMPRKPGEWQSFDITLIGRTVTVVQNGETIIHNQEIPGITGGALDSHEELPGPIYLQGSEKGHVAFRSLVITPARK